MKVVFKKCHYCNIEPFVSTKIINNNGAEHFLYNGIDRIDNNKGYVLNNVVPCCKQCNFAKYIQTYDEFKNYIKRLVEYNKTL